MNNTELTLDSFLRKSFLFYILLYYYLTTIIMRTSNIVLQHRTPHPDLDRAHHVPAGSLRGRVEQGVDIIAGPLTKSSPASSTAPLACFAPFYHLLQPQHPLQILVTCRETCGYCGGRVASRLRAWYRGGRSRKNRRGGRGSWWMCRRDRDRCVRIM